MAEPCTWTKKESDALKIAVDVHKVSFFDSFFYCTIILTVDILKITQKKKLFIPFSTNSTISIHFNLTLFLISFLPFFISIHSTFKQSKNWKKIVVAVGGKKTEEQCMFHWRNVLCPVVVKGKGSWTPEEDLALQALGTFLKTLLHVVVFFHNGNLKKKAINIF